MTLLHPSARYSLLVRQRIRVALGAAAALAAISLSPGSAQAYVVTVGGVQYDVTTFTGSYNGNESKFATAANNGVMPWWGNGTLVMNFATAVGTNLGSPNSNHGPYFGYIETLVDLCSGLEFSCEELRISSKMRNPGGAYVELFVPVQFSQSWAQATLYTDPAPVPAPLPLLGAALPLSFCRRLSSRSKRLRHGASRLA